MLFCMCFSTPICIVLIYERLGFNGIILIAALVGWLVLQFQSISIQKQMRQKTEGESSPYQTNRCVEPEISSLCLSFRMLALDRGKGI